MKKNKRKHIYEYIHHYLIIIMLFIYIFSGVILFPLTNDWKYLIGCILCFISCIICADAKGKNKYLSFILIIISYVFFTFDSLKIILARPELTDGLSIKYLEFLGPSVITFILPFVLLLLLKIKKKIINDESRAFYMYLSFCVIYISAMITKIISAILK